MRGESTIDEAADPDHAYTALVIPDEDMFIAVHAHDDDAVITQLVDVEIVAPDARSQRGDERADFGGREHLVEARLLHVEDFSLERQNGPPPETFPRAQDLSPGNRQVSRAGPRCRARPYGASFRAPCARPRVRRRPREFY